MQKRYDAVIFDLDGTLLNTLEDLQGSVNYALAAYQMPQRSLEEIRRFVGNGVQRLIELAVPQKTSEEMLEGVFSSFKEHYAIHCNDKTDLFPGIQELLVRLKAEGFRTAIVSNKLQEGVDALYKQYFEKNIEVAIGAREGIRKKPAPDSVFEAMKLLDAHKKRTVYIGDSEVDIATAHNAGLPCITVTWGFRNKQEQEEAGGDVFAETPEEIFDLLHEY